MINEKMKYEIKKMETCHVPQAAAIEAKVFSEPWTAQDFTNALALDYTLFYVAWINSTDQKGADGDVAGYCGIYLAADEGDITNVAVSPGYRRLGIAKSLVRHALLQAHAKGAWRVFLEVRSSNTPAIELYRKLGFCVKGKRKNYYRFPDEDALVMMYEFADK